MALHSTNSGGGSAIIGPEGEHLAGPVYEGEKVLTAELSLEDDLPGKPLHNVLGHYTRGDVLSLYFNREWLSAFRNVRIPEHSSTDIEAINRELAEIRDVLTRVADKLD